MKLTGHKTESIYRRYAIVSEADLSAGVEKLAKLYSGETRTRSAHARAAGSRESRREMASPTRAGSNTGVAWLRAVDALRIALETAA
jgi:hypothetical protein